MKNLKYHFKFNKQEQSGIFFLLLIIIVLQCLYFFLVTQPSSKTGSSATVDYAGQELVDSLKHLARAKDTVKPFNFNPNYISDYRGYLLGMSVTEIDRLHEFRASGKFVNSAKAFQEVTKVSDSLLHQIKGRFQFPKWTQQPQRKKSVPATKKNRTIAKKDINLASAHELRAVNGIGATLSQRIVKFRDRLGGFMDAAQLYDVYGLEKEVVARALEHFEVKTLPEIKKMNINQASAGELAGLIYISYQLADEIVTYRNKNGPFDSFAKLAEVKGFPKHKLHRITLYLSL